MTVKEGDRRTHPRDGDSAVSSHVSVAESGDSTVTRNMRELQTVLTAYCFDSVLIELCHTC